MVEQDSKSAAMQVKVRFFAAPREALGTSELAVEVPPGTTVGDLVDLLIEQHPILRPFT